MPEDLLSAALEQAEGTDAAVKSAALLHAARVVACTDQAAAVRMLDRGIALAQELPERARTLILGNAICLAAAVSPKRALELYAAHRRPGPFDHAIMALVNVMATHGHIDTAIAYLNDPLPGDRFPFSFLGNLERECRDDATRRKLLEAAIAAWEKHHPDPGPGPDHFAAPAFVGFFSRFWQLLPREQASRLLPEILAWARQLPPEPSFPTRPPTMLLPALEALHPKLAQSLLRDDPRLAESLAPAQPEPSPASEPAVCEDAMMIGSCFGTEDDEPNSQIIYMTEALATDFKAAFDEAFFRYSRDVEWQNHAPKECWPSTNEFRNILFKAGQHIAVAAAKYLDRIPDSDLRLLSQIELCAAIAGLPQQAGNTIVYPARKREPVWIRAAAAADPATTESVEDTTHRDSGGPFIRCPKCGWVPRPEDRWTCHCGHSWNTFDTGGVCPGCQYQWKITMCPACGQWSAHSDWYAAK
jgi:hypothetical protein